MPANEIIDAVAVQPGPGLVHEADMPVQVGQGNAIYGLLHCCLELQQLLLGPLALGDVRNKAVPKHRSILFPLRHCVAKE